MKHYVCKPCNREFLGYGNSICEECEEGAETIINLRKKFDTENGKIKSSTSTHSRTSSCEESLSTASQWVADLTEKQTFLHGLVDAYRNQTPIDVLVKPGNNGSSIVAHRTLLAARSNIFKNMLESDKCKATRLETITLPELNHEELKSLLDFLYSGSLPRETLEKHLYPLSRAARKYEISYLQTFIQNFMLEGFHSGDALSVLEFLDFGSIQTITDDMLSFIVEHKSDIILSDEYEVFAAKNPHLSLQITRALLMGAKEKTIFC